MSIGYKMSDLSIAQMSSICVSTPYSITPKTTRSTMTKTKHKKLAHCMVDARHYDLEDRILLAISLTLESKLREY